MLPDSVKNFTFKDWLYVIGLVVSLSMAWAVLNSKVDRLAEEAHASSVRQTARDSDQDVHMKEAVSDIKQALRDQTTELKVELREIRREIQTKK